MTEEEKFERINKLFSKNQFSEVAENNRKFYEAHIEKGFTPTQSMNLTMAFLNSIMNHSFRNQKGSKEEWD